MKRKLTEKTVSPDGDADGPVKVRSPRLRALIERLHELSKAAEQTRLEAERNSASLRAYGVRM